MIDTIRHLELIDVDTFTDKITVIGAGSTGSFVVLQLAKLGFKNIEVWDFDIVESHNIANQAYSIADIGRSKVEALYDLVKQQTGTEIKTYNKAFTNQRLAGIVFLMVDSMKVRADIWNASLKMKSAIKLVIEPRMGIDTGRIYNIEPINMNQIKAYEDTYYSDDVAEVSSCGASMTVITSAMTIAAWCVRQLISFHNKEELDNEILIDFKYNNTITTRW
jgi:tRNA A37 threonylcarbamoyladenosine dehydratase